MRAWLVGVVLATGCVDAHLTLCGDGTACPDTLVCDHAHASCVAPDQLTACEGVADGAACQTSELAGECFDGVCLAPGCGNKVVEPGEQCDDGNHTGGDGCSNDCRSDERCGNGVADVGLGEACDDGNLVSHDGCDSRCQVEAPHWRMFPVSLTGGATNTAAFDAAHGQLVYPAHRTVWLWDGSVWSVSPVLPPAVDTWSASAYDADRQHVVAFAVRAGAPVVLDWDGTQWIELAPTGAPPDGRVLLAVGDPVQHAVMWLTSDSFGYLAVSGAGAAWTSAGLLPFQVTATTRAAFDGTRTRTVVVDASVSGTWEYDGTTWTRTQVSPPGSGGHALVYDSDRSALVAVGGIVAGETTSDLATWNGTDWTALAPQVTARSSPTVWHDPAHHLIGVFGGVDAQNRALNDLVTVAGTAVSPFDVVSPSGDGPIAYDASHDRIVAIDSTQTEAWDGTTWRAIIGTPPPLDAKLVFDPIRGAVVAFDTHTLTVSQLDQSWRVIANGFSANAAAFDYTRKGVVAVSTIGGYLVGENNAISAIAPAPPDLPVSAAYDLGGARITVLGTNGLSDLVNAQWQRSLAPSGQYGVVSALQTASVLLVPEGAVDETRAIWERSAGSFRQVDAMPFAATVTDAVERSRGRLDILLADGPSHLLLERQLSSTLPDESCLTGDTQDADGDGVTGCADADCWATCWPSCPLATSCP